MNSLDQKFATKLLSGATVVRITNKFRRLTDVHGCAGRQPSHCTGNVPSESSYSAGHNENSGVTNCGQLRLAGWDETTVVYSWYSTVTA